MSDRIVITAVHCMTPVGLDATSTAIAVRAGVSGLRVSDQFDDSYGEPILESCIPWLPSEVSPAESDEAIDVESPSDADVEDEDDEVEERDEAPDVELDAIEEAPDEEQTHAYELARQTDDVTRLSGAARHSLSQLLESYVVGSSAWSRPVRLLLGVAPPERPGPRFEGEDEELAADLVALIRGRTGRADADVIRTGQAAGIRALQQAVAGLARDPTAVYIIGAIDSLLALDTLNWLEDAERLKSGTFGRHQGLPPAEAVGFLVAETETSARRAGRATLATVAGVALAQEPHPFVSDTPSRAEGLTEACLSALDASGIGGGDLEAVLSDLDGEFHRAKQWALAEIRALGSSPDRALLHPADCFGTIGATSAVVLLDIAAVGLSRGWFTRPVLVVCSDDTGECGAVVLVPSHD